MWLGDTRIRTLAACQTLPGAVALVTVTAPGQDVLPWDASGRRVDADAARAWNETAPARWSALHRGAARAARRVADDHGATWRLLVKAWEYQRRGVLHLHLLVPAGTPGELRASTAYVRELAGGASAQGFGFVDRGKLPAAGARGSARELSPVSPHRAAAYVASYVASSGAGKGGVAEVARRQGVPGAIVYVSQRLTAVSGVTMRSLRARRRIACQWPGAAESVEAWQAGRALDAMLRGHPPLTDGARGALLRRATAERWRCTVDARTGEARRLTPAAAPSLPAGGQSMLQPPPTDALVRLDSVLHRGHESPGPGWITTVTVLDTWRSPRHRTDETG